MIVFDTKEAKEYRGNLEYALEMFKHGECDAIMTRGTDYVCVKYSDPHIAKLARKRTDYDISHAELRYVIIKESSDGTTSCQDSGYKFSSNFNHAIFYRTKEAADSALSNLAKRLNSKVENGKLCCEGNVYKVETYLYRSSDCCFLRIYYGITGLSTDYGLLQFIRSQINAGVLFARKDRGGKEYIFLDELLLFKDEEIIFKSASGVDYKRKIDLRLVLHDGLIAFDAITKFVKDNPDLKIPEIQYLTSREYGTDLRSFYDLGSVIYSDSEVRERAVKSLGLANWFID